MAIIPKKENPSSLGYVIFVSADQEQIALSKTAFRESVYRQDFCQDLSESKVRYRNDPAHLVVLDESLGLDAITEFVEDIRSTHRNQLFMVMFDDYEASKIQWYIDNNLDQMLIRPFEKHRYVELVDKLVETKKLLRSFLDVEKKLDAYDKAMNQSFVVVKSTPSGLITDVNDAFSELTEFSKETILGENVHMLVAKNSESQVEELLKTIGQKDVYKARMNFHKRDGSDFITDVVVFPIIDANDEIIEVVSFMQDVTELVMTGRQLIAERTEHEKKLNDVKDYYLEVFSNELRTPTHAILNFTEDVAQKVGDGNFEDKDELLYSLGVVAHNGERIMGLVSSLLNLSRIRSGKDDVSVSTVNVQELLRLIIAKYSHLVQQNNINVHLECDANSLIRTDNTKLQLISDALLGNAVKYGKNEISISFKTDDNSFEFIVEDNGSGIENLSEMLALFKLSDMLQLSQQSHGIGLGLYMTTLLCKILKFDLSLEPSERLGGLKATVRGPRDFDSLKA